MPDLFVSFFGRRGGQEARGWVVLNDVPPLACGKTVEALHKRIEELRGYDENTLSIVTFQRLEAPAGH